MRFLLCLLLLIPSLSWAGMNGYVCGVDIPASTCTTAVDSDTSGTTVIKIGSASAYREAGGWTTTEAFCLCKMDVILARIGSPTGNVTLKMYAAGTDKPTGSAIATATETLTAADFAVDGTYYVKTFTFSTCLNLSNATEYWYSLESDALNSAEVYFATKRNAAQVTSGKYAYYTSGWVSEDTTSEVYRVPYK